jgi:hypothetical protein
MVIQGTLAVRSRASWQEPAHTAVLAYLGIRVEFTESLDGGL